MDIHKNAPLTPKGREAMVRSVVEGGLSHAAAAVEPTLSVRSAMLERRCHRIDRSKMTGIRCVCKGMPAIPHIASAPCPCRRGFAPFRSDQTYSDREPENWRADKQMKHRKDRDRANQSCQSV